MRKKFHITKYAHIASLSYQRSCSGSGLQSCTREARARKPGQEGPPSQRTRGQDQRQMPGFQPFRILHPHTGMGILGFGGARFPGSYSWKFSVLKLRSRTFSSRACSQRVSAPWRGIGRSWVSVAAIVVEAVVVTHTHTHIYMYTYIYIYTHIYT